MYIIGIGYLSESDSEPPHDHLNVTTPSPLRSEGPKGLHHQAKRSRWVRRGMSGSGVRSRWCAELEDFAEDRPIDRRWLATALKWW